MEEDGKIMNSVFLYFALCFLISVILGVWYMFFVYRPESDTDADIVFASLFIFSISVAFPVTLPILALIGLLLLLGKLRDWIEL